MWCGAVEVMGSSGSDEVKLGMGGSIARGEGSVRVMAAVRVSSEDARLVLVVFVVFAQLMP